MARMQQAVEASQACGDVPTGPRKIALLAEAYGRIGQPATGRALVADMLTLAEQTGGVWWDPELHRLKGELLLHAECRVPSAELTAEACFRLALAIARRQQARSWELRAALSLGRLWQQQGKQRVARGLLAPVYACFSAGFDTPDLQEAKT